MAKVESTVKRVMARDEFPYWGAPHNRARLSSDPGNKFRTEKQD